MTRLITRGVRSVGHTALRVGVALSLLVLLFVGVGPFTGRYRVVTVLSGSMTPTLPVGSVAVSTPERLEQVRVGQVITFAAPVGSHSVETHRVIQVVSGGPHPVVRTQGDGNATPDPWLARLDTGRVWRVRAVVPMLGTGIHLLRSRGAHVASVLLAPALLAILSLAWIWRPSGDDIDGQPGGSALPRPALAPEPRIT
jgi:signal peptidase I